MLSRFERPVERNFWSSSKEGPSREKQGNEAVIVVHKMAAGRTCRQQDQSLPKNVWYYRERQKHLQNTGTPVLLPDRRTPVICTGFLPLHAPPTTLSATFLWRAYRIDISQTWIHDTTTTTITTTTTKLYQHSNPTASSALVQCNNRFETHSGYTHIDACISSTSVLSVRTERS